MTTSDLPPPAPDGAPESSDSICPNCGSHRLRRYCAECGQAAPRAADYSLRAHAADLIDLVAGLDGKVVRSVWALVARPGVLTVDHLSGRRARYLRPLQLFLLVNLLLFLAAPRMPLFSYSFGNYLTYAPPSPALVATLVERAMANGRSRTTSAPALGGSTSAENAEAYTAYVAAFDGRVEAQRKSLIVLFAPALALLLRVLFVRRAAPGGVPRTYGEHLVFAIHVLAFVWLVFVGWGLVAALTGRVEFGRVGSAGILAILIAILFTAPAYVFQAVRRVYELSPLPSLALTGVLAAAFIGLLVAYRTLLFFTTYYTL